LGSNSLNGPVLCTPISGQLAESLPDHKVDTVSRWKNGPAEDANKYSAHVLQMMEKPLVWYKQYKNSVEI
jgi:hypothetical protein